MLHDYAFQGLDNQTVIEVGGGDYTNSIENSGGSVEGIPDKVLLYNLFKEQPDIPYEENLFKTITMLPNEDPMELLGVTINQEIQINYTKSLRLLKFL